MHYKIKEIFYTLQGEGHHSGRPAIFCRFTGCNLWSGLEKDRDTAICRFCDTEFFGMDGTYGGKYTSADLVDMCLSLWPKKSTQPPMVVCTGGEPMLQMDQELIQAFHRKNFFIAVETNGTLPCPDGIDWICMSPKANTEIILDRVNEIKLVYPQKNIYPSQFNSYDADHFYIQPMDDVNQSKHIAACIEYCLQHPQWHLSLQSHKTVGLR